MGNHIIEQIADLNHRLLEAERFAREQYDACQTLYADLKENSDYDVDFECELVCWLREDDPDWSEDNDNVIYCNSSISIHDKPPLDDDWNTFRSWEHDPMGGRSCGYFMHELIDHGNLGTTDLLRIGDLSINFKRILMKEIRYPKNFMDIMAR